MTTHHPTYDAYLLRIWQEPAEGRSPPTHYFLLEQLFDERQRWLFTDPTEFQTHLQEMLSASSTTANQAMDE